MASSSHRNGKGRQKVKMVKMENKSNLQVTFSKRRYGLFKKASELCTLTGAKVGIIVYSPGRKAFSFGHPSIHKLIDKVFPDAPPGFDGVGGPMVDERLVEAHRNANLAELNMGLSVLDLQIEAEKGRALALEERETAELGSHAPIEKMDDAQLENLFGSLHVLKLKLMMMLAANGCPVVVDQGLDPVGEMGNLDPSMPHELFY